MKNQLMYTVEPFDPNRFDPITNQIKWLKPTGGMWTCDLMVEDGKVFSEWVPFVTDELPSRFRRKLNNCTKFVPRKGLKILEATTIYDIEQYLYLPPKYEYHKHVDWEKIGKEYDGVHVEMGRFDDTVEFLFAGWDISSTLWLNPDWYESYSVIYQTDVH